MPRRYLVGYSMTSTHVQTTRDYLMGLKRHLGGEVDFLHVTHDAVMDVDLSKYDAVFHNYCARLCFPGYVSKSYCDALAAYEGVKVMAVQDEYNNTNILKAAIRDLGFDLLLTCVPQDSLEYVYPRSELPRTEFMTVFTGYVPDEFAAAHKATLPVGERPIPLGYRGRDIGALYGRLGYEKYEVGRRMREECEKRGIPCDIAMDEESRIYGDKWFEFIGNCRAMLGSESGSNVFDFDGAIKARYDAMTARRGGVPPSYQDFAPIIAKQDSEIEMGQISPRIFECAVMRTPMVLIKGRYSDAITPDLHYIPLERDFSNAGEVLKRLEDIESLSAMADRTFQDVVASGRFGYGPFVGRIRERIEAIAERKAATPKTATAKASRTSRSAETKKNVILREQPTPEPMGLETFRYKQAKLYSEYYAGRARYVRKTLVGSALSMSRSLDDLEKTLQFVGKHVSAANQDKGSRDFEAAVAMARSQIDEIAARAKNYDMTRQSLHSQLSSMPPSAVDERKKIERRAIELDQTLQKDLSSRYKSLMTQIWLARGHLQEIAEASQGSLSLGTRASLAYCDTRMFLRKPKTEVLKEIAMRMPMARRIGQYTLTQFGRLSR